MWPVVWGNQKPWEAKADANSADKEGWSPLHLASWQGHLQAVTMLLEAQADVDASTLAGITPLHVAHSCDQTDVVKVLLGYTSDKDAAVTEVTAAEAPIAESRGENHDMPEMRNSILQSSKVALAIGLNPKEVRESIFVTQGM